MLEIIENLIPWAGPYQALIDLLTNVDITFPMECRFMISGQKFQLMVQLFGKYLKKACCSVPPGLCIVVEGEESISYYFYEPGE